MVIILEADLSESVSQAGIEPAEVVSDQPLLTQSPVKMNKHDLKKFLSFSSSQILPPDVWK